VGSRCARWVGQMVYRRASAARQVGCLQIVGTPPAGRESME
jgi:hypothetical protein